MPTPPCSMRSTAVPGAATRRTRKTASGLPATDSNDGCDEEGSARSPLCFQARMESEMSVCKLCLVSGRVQGVFYRASTVRLATELGVTGYAKNLPDGRVEVLVCGERQAVDTLVEWLWKGPSAARVENVEVREADIAEAPRSFGAM